jgi:hypothetical protein
VRRARRSSAARNASCLCASANCVRTWADPTAHWSCEACEASSCPPPLELRSLRSLLAPPPPSTLRASAALPAGRLPDLTPSPLEGVRCDSDLTRSLALMPGTLCGPNLALSLPPAPTGVQCDSDLTQSLALVPGSQCDPDLTPSQPLLPPLWLPPLAPLPVMRSA